MKYSLGMLLGAAALLAACASGSKIEREVPTPLADFIAERQVKVAWESDFGTSTKQFIKLSPNLDGNAIYVSDPRGHVSAFAADSGRVLWRKQVDRPVTGATGAGEGLVLVADKKGQLDALKMTDGTPLWSSSLSSEVLAPAVVHAGIVVVQTVDGKLTGLSAADGKRLWVDARSEPALSLRGTCSPIVVDDVVLTGFANGKIAALQIQDGKLLWELAVSEARGRNEIERLTDVDASPLVVGDVLYAASYQGKIIAVELPTGKIIWSRDTSTFSGMDADSTNIYLTDDKDNVVALDQRTGASVWRQEKLRARGLNAPRYIDGLIAVGDFEGYVHWLSKDDGHFVARHRIGGGAVRSQAIAGADTLYVATQSGVLTALQLGKN